MVGFLTSADRLRVEPFFAELPDLVCGSHAATAAEDLVYETADHSSKIRFLRFFCRVSYVFSNYAADESLI